MTDNIKQDLDKFIEQTALLLALKNTNFTTAFFWCTAVARKHNIDLQDLYNEVLELHGAVKTVISNAELNRVLY